jgi:CrcB protein
MGDAFPWSTLVINISGALALGVVVALMSEATDTALRPALTIGLLGGFTTFSSFAVEAVSLAEESGGARAFGYVVVMNSAGIAAAAAGIAISRAVLRA